MITFEINSCIRKVKFKTRKKAENKIKSLSKIGFIMDNPRIYECEFCGYYHIAKGYSKKYINQLFEWISSDKYPDPVK